MYSMTLGTLRLSAAMVPAMVIPGIAAVMIVWELGIGIFSYVGYKKGEKWPAAIMVAITAAATFGMQCSHIGLGVISDFGVLHAIDPSMNLPSRFTEEIPEEDLERQGVSAQKKPGADEEAERPARQFDKKRYYGPFGAERQRPNQVHAPSPAPAASEKPKFNLGDRVVHRAFGKGEITKVTPMGGDALIEITFDEVGVKRLMLRAASQHMKKET